MENGSRAQEILSRMEAALLRAFGDLDGGTVTLRFMAFGPDVELAIEVVPQPEGGAREAIAHLLESVSLASIMELRRDMVEPQRGAWLSGQAVLDCLSEEVHFTFNHSRRFNVLAEGWLHHQGDSEVWPDRQGLLQDLARHPRSPEFTPPWVEDLRAEQRDVERLVRDTRPDELFSEQLEATPVLEGSYGDLGGDPLWSETWEALGRSYVSHLLRTKALRQPFVDPDMGRGQAMAIFDILEPRVREDFTRQFIASHDVDNQARFLVALAQATGDDDGWYQALESGGDLDTELLGEDLEEVISELVMSQTRQRFPDLEESD